MRFNWPRTGIVAYNRYKKCIIPQIIPPVLSCYCHLSTDNNIYIVSEIVTTSVAITNYSFFYVENYLHQLDVWRFEESRYEEKLDPPEWNLRIVKPEEHRVNILLLLAAIITNFYYISWISIIFQMIALNLSLNKIEISADLFLNCFLFFM